MVQQCLRASGPRERLDMAHPGGSGRQRVLRYGPARRLPAGPI